VTTPVQAPLYTASVVQIASGQTKPLLLSATDPFAIYTLWISISGATKPAFNPGTEAVQGAQIVDEEGDVLLRCQIHLSAANQSADDAISIYLAGLTLTDRQAPFEMTFVTDTGVSGFYFRASGGIYYGTAGSPSSSVQNLAKLAPASCGCPCDKCLAFVSTHTCATSWCKEPATGTRKPIGVKPT
jgi:hypothetical protein